MQSYQGRRAICFLVFTISSITVVSSLHLRAVFDMSGIRGEIGFTRGANGYTRISTNLTGITSDLVWKIHQYPVVYRGNRMHTCKDIYTGRMFDPMGKSSHENYTISCNAKMYDMCAVGDLNGKHGHLNSSTNILHDSNLPVGGPNSIFGRTVVLYINGSTPWACALIDYDDVITAVTTFRGSISGITGTVRLRQPRGNVSMDTSVEIDLFYSNDAKKGSHNLTLELADSFLPEDGRPSFEGEACNKATSRVISHRVNVPLARGGPSSERLLLSLVDLPLDGAKNVTGKTLVLKEHGKPVICGMVFEVIPIEADVIFNVDGVKGSFHYKQDSELAPTVVTANISGLNAEANTYHVHVYRVLDKAFVHRKNSKAMCAGTYLAGHWKPYNTKSASPGIETVDQYEVGDLSGKYGTIGAKDTLSFVRKDYNLPLFGANSILFRSMVIHYNDSSRWVCSNINPKGETYHFAVKANFIGPEFNGSIVVQQASFVRKHGASHITSFFLDLNYMNDSRVKTSSHNWHVHAKDIVQDQTSKMGSRCKSAQTHYNPFKVSLKANYSKTCGPMNLLRCELGDISSKVGKYSIGGGKNRFTESENYFASMNTILGRSIVVHAKDGGGPRVGCANMELISHSFVEKSLTFKNTTARFDNFTKVLARTLGIKPWRVVHHKPITGYRRRCEKTSFVLIDSRSSNLSKDFEDLKKLWPSNLKEFEPVSDDECDEPIRPTDHASTAQPTASTAQPTASTTQAAASNTQSATTFVLMTGFLLTNLFI